MAPLTEHDRLDPAKLLAEGRSLRKTTWLLLAIFILMPIVNSWLAFRSGGFHATVVLIVPILVLGCRASFRRSRVLMRVGQNHCPRCGYDQTASVGRCAECGLGHEDWAEFIAAKKHGLPLRIVNGASMMAALLALLVHHRLTPIVGLLPVIIASAALVMIALVTTARMQYAPESL